MVYSNFSNYLSNNKTQPKESHTHTRIGDKKKIYGGSFNIKNQKEFYDNYYNHVFEDNKKEYLTEKQLPNGQILIDLDFRYTNEIKRRQHNEVHIDKLVKLYVEKIQEIYDIPQNKKFPVFVLEKLNVNCLKDKTKDGIHIIFGISSTAEQQLYLRKKLFLKATRLSRPLIDRFFSASQTIFSSIIFFYRMLDIGASPLVFSKFLIDNFDRMPDDFSIEVFTYLVAKKKKFHIKRFEIFLSERKNSNSSWNTGLISKFKLSLTLIKSSIMIKIRDLKE